MSINPTIGPLILPSNIDAFQTPFFNFSNPTSNSKGTFTYSSNNNNVIKILNNNQGVITGNGTVTITATQAANGSYLSGFVSKTVTISNSSGGTINNNINTNKITNVSSDGKIKITNYNPFTNVIPNDGFKWLYFKYDYVNYSSNIISHWFNGSINLAGDIPFSYNIGNTDYIYVLYTGYGGKGGAKNGPGGGTGEICITKIDVSKINPDRGISISSSGNSTSGGYSYHDRTSMLYNTNDNKILSKEYYANNGYDATNNQDSTKNGKGAAYQSYSAYGTDTHSFGSLDGGLANKPCTSGLNIYFSYDANHNASFGASDGTGSFSTTTLSSPAKITDFYGGKGGTSSAVSSAASQGFAMIFYRVQPTYYTFTYS